LAKQCAVKGAGLQRVQLPPGNWFAPCGNNRSGGGGNEAVGAFDVEGRMATRRNLCSPTVQARFAALNLRNLRLRGSLRYLVLTGVPDDSQRQIQTRQAAAATPIAEHLRASIHRIRPRTCFGHQSQRCRNVPVCHRESAFGISNSN
jgi:hypothetical protein